MGGKGNQGWLPGGRYGRIKICTPTPTGFILVRVAGALVEGWLVSQTVGASPLSVDASAGLPTRGEPLMPRSPWKI